jgi:hypothetical protein
MSYQRFFGLLLILGGFVAPTIAIADAYGPGAWTHPGWYIVQKVSIGLAVNGGPYSSEKECEFKRSTQEYKVNDSCINLQTRPDWDK